MSEADAVINSPQAEIPPASGGLSWEDLLFLSKQSWALRHVPTLDRAKREMEVGIPSGDAVSLAAPQNLIPNEVLTELNIDRKNLASFSIAHRFVPAQNRQQVVSNFEQAIMQFIEAGVGFDLNTIASGTTTEEAIQRLTGAKAAFVVAKFQGAAFPYDLDSYYQLGKTGQENVAPENMIALVNAENSLKETMEGLAFSSEEQHSPLSKEKFDKIKTTTARVVGQKLVAVIKEKNQVKITA